MDVAQAIKDRRSCRSFLDRPVERPLLEEVCGLAALAPSAINLQPWLFTLLMKDELERLSRKLIKTFQERGLGCSAEVRAYLPDVYTQRQQDIGNQMAPAIKATTHPWGDFINEGSLNFYGAPAAFIISGEAALANDAQFDVGLATGYLILACQEKGLSTCPIGLVGRYSSVVQEFLNLDEGRPVILALAVGYADPEAPVNKVKTGRAPFGEVFRFYG